MPIDWTKPIETLDGKPARVLSTDHRYCGETLVVIQIEYLNFSSNGYYHQNGKPTLGSPEIRNRKTKRVGWVNLYPALCQEGKAIITKIHESEEAAKANASSAVIATIKIEWEEP